ncbi:MAG: protein serine/threonine phosphatase [Acidobacteriaceae bacterium]|nr:protein serine/threonine phosphatase [Acidobacteriaceae bacterium]
MAVFSQEKRHPSRGSAAPQQVLCPHVAFVPGSRECIVFCGALCSSLRSKRFAKNALPTDTLIYAMLSHRGRVRRGNEDACAASLSAGAFVVCDGMGGAAGGEVASLLAAETFLRHVANPTSGKTPQARIQAAVQAANHAIFQKATQNTELSGMGTTLVALLYVPPKPGPVLQPKPLAAITIQPVPPSLWLAHVGDSRCYLYRGRMLTQLTEDHSLVEEQLRAGQITAAEAAASPMRNLITRAVGSQATVEVDVQALRPQPGDLYLLASDGLNRELSDADIATVLADIPSPPTEPYLAAACQSLITAANHSGGRDNITVLLLAFPKGIERRKPRATMQ